MLVAVDLCGIMTAIARYSDGFMIAKALIAFLAGEAFLIGGGAAIVIGEDFVVSSFC